MVYVDRLFHWPLKTELWCHLWADTVGELHSFAAGIGLKRCWFQAKKKAGFPHYDIRPGIRARAIHEGAQESSIREFIKKKKIQMVRDVFSARIF